MISTPFNAVRNASRNPGPAPRSRRRGVAATEFAVLAPILVLFIMGIFELGRAFMVKDVLDNAARKACRTGCLPLADNTAITTDVKNLLTDNKIDTASVKIDIQVNGKTADVKNAKPGDKISVKVSIPYAKVSWITPFFLKDKDVTSQTLVMLRQA